jgi:hypothetical protein
MDRIKDFIDSRAFLLTLIIVLIVNTLEFFLKLKFYWVIILYIMITVIVVYVDKLISEYTRGGIR